MDRLRSLARAAVNRLSDAIDRWSKYDVSRYPELELDDLMRVNFQLLDDNAELHDEVDRLERDVQGLQDEIGSLQFNGPNLYLDEVRALRMALAGSHLTENERAAIRGLIARGDHVPVTAGKFSDDIIAATSGTLVPWHDVFPQDCECAECIVTKKSGE